MEEWKDGGKRWEKAIFQSSNLPLPFTFDALRITFIDELKD
jgi:hypothetical protein